jgi:hypothetical protein
MQVTIVALIGDKPTHLEAFLDECKARVVAELGPDFRGYDTSKQIHATIVGLERVDANKPAFLNENFKMRRQLQLEMDYSSLLDYFRTSGVFPMQIQIAGFHNRDYPFISRNERPFFRSFSIQPGRNQDGKEIEFVVVMGWPLRGEPSTDPNPTLPWLIQETLKFPRSLDSLRRTAQTFNVLHAYHPAPTDVDNDFFFRIGIIDNPKNVNSNTKRQLVHTMRTWLAGCCPVIVDVKLSDVWVTQYTSTELPPNATTKPYRINDPNVDANFCRSLY